MDIYNLNQLLYYRIDDYLKSNNIFISKQEILNIQNIILYNDIRNTNYSKNFINIDNKLYYNLSLIDKLYFYDSLNTKITNNLQSIIFIGETHEDSINNIGILIKENLNLLNDIKLYTNIYTESNFINIESSVITRTDINYFNDCDNSNGSYQNHGDRCYPNIFYNFIDPRTNFKIRNFYTNKIISNIIDFNLIEILYGSFNEISNDNYDYFNVLSGLFLFLSVENVDKDKLKDYIVNLNYKVLSKKYYDNTKDEIRISFVDICKILGINYIDKKYIFDFVSNYNTIINEQIEPYDNIERVVNFINNYLGLLFFILFFDNTILKNSNLYKYVSNIRNFYLKIDNIIYLEIFIKILFNTNVYISDLYKLDLVLDNLKDGDFSNDEQYLMDNIQLFMDRMTNVITSLNTIVLDLNTFARIVIRDSDYKKVINPLYQSEIKYSVVYTGALHSKILYNVFYIANEIDKINDINKKREYIFNYKLFNVEKQKYINPNLQKKVTNKYGLTIDYVMSFKDIFINEQYKDYIKNNFKIILNKGNFLPYLFVNQYDSVKIYLKDKDDNNKNLVYNNYCRILLNYINKYSDFLYSNYISNINLFEKNSIEIIINYLDQLLTDDIVKDIYSTCINIFYNLSGNKLYNDLILYLSSNVLLNEIFNNIVFTIVQKFGIKDYILKLLEYIKNNDISGFIKYNNYYSKNEYFIKIKKNDENFDIDSIRYLFKTFIIEYLVIISNINIDISVLQTVDLENLSLFKYLKFILISITNDPILNENNVNLKYFKQYNLDYISILNNINYELINDYDKYLIL